MTTTEIIEAAAKHYSAEFPLVYWDNKRERVKDATVRCGDTLARFIVVEISENDDPTLSDSMRIANAIAVLTHAISDIGSARQGLREMLGRLTDSEPQCATCEDCGVIEDKHTGNNIPCPDCESEDT